ncbi:MAG TPA: J domain-containing protein [Arenimonas sp.]|uniref:J domain-containing protein n=1 Tax=Arenimonas sp. TaxID=1872635 RepID=UPI002C1519E1|nr:J domain-containing protein [Arenimonas sp.]HMB56087.1 J domain-containing protein [Arenimonas sp.]
MTRWKGKVIGFLLGVLTRRPQFMVLGLVLGHLYDIGIFGGQVSAPPPPPPPQATMLDHYATLGLLPTASDDEVEQAWRRLISEYHPDRVASAAKEIRELAETRAREINAAYESIQQQRHKG